MGKYLLEFVVPAILLIALAGPLVRFWYFKIFPKVIKTNKKVNEASKQYDKDIKKK